MTTIATMSASNMTTRRMLRQGKSAAKERSRGLGRAGGSMPIGLSCTRIERWRRRPRTGIARWRAIRGDAVAVARAVARAPLPSAQVPHAQAGAPVAAKRVDVRVREHVDRGARARIAIRHVERDRV